MATQARRWRVDAIHAGEDAKVDANGRKVMD
jgi:hypothetical protein